MVVPVVGVVVAGRRAGCAGFRVLRLSVGGRSACYPARVVGRFCSRVKIANVPARLVFDAALEITEVISIWNDVAALA